MHGGSLLICTRSGSFNLKSLMKAQMVLGSTCGSPDKEGAVLLLLSKGIDDNEESARKVKTLGSRGHQN